MAGFGGAGGAAGVAAAGGAGGDGIGSGVALGTFSVMSLHFPF